MSAPSLGWIGIVRIGLVQMAIGANVVLTTATLNRVMVVEWGLPALLPGSLIAFYYALQFMRPRFGYGSDTTGRRTPWILGGMVVLGTGGVLAATATAWMGSNVFGGIVLAILAFALIGLGVGAAGTSLLALLAKRVDERRRAAAATIVWTMMIAGLAVTAGVAAQFLEPFSTGRLIAVSGVTAGVALALTIVGLWGVEKDSESMSGEASQAGAAAERPPFRDALRQIWTDPSAQRFTIFVFVSMLAFNGQDAILEPFAGIAFDFSPSASTQLSGVLHGGVLAGMLLLGVTATVVGRHRLGSLRGWTVGGCVASGAALAMLAVSGVHGPPWPLQVNVFALGVANGVFTVGALGCMMALAGKGQAGREGTRMGVWGASQAFAFGLGTLLGTAGVDATRYLVGTPVLAYVLVFAVEALLFLYAVRLIFGVGGIEGSWRRGSRVTESYATGLDQA
jgi:BCD family chlorophyll transporter-like MFS transporter